MLRIGSPFPQVTPGYTSDDLLRTIKETGPPVPTSNNFGQVRDKKKDVVSIISRAIKGDTKSCIASRTGQVASKGDKKILLIHYLQDSFL